MSNIGTDISRDKERKNTITPWSLSIGWARKSKPPECHGGSSSAVLWRAQKEKLEALHCLELIQKVSSLITAHAFGPKYGDRKTSPESQPARKQQPPKKLWIRATKNLMWSIWFPWSSLHAQARVKILLSRTTSAFNPRIIIVLLL